MKQVLIIDDSAVIRRLLRDYFQQSDVTVVECETAADALVAVGKQPFDLCICDTHLASVFGPELSEPMRKIQPNLPILFLNSLPDQPDHLIQNSLCLQKPFELDQLRDGIKALLQPVYAQAR